MKWHQKLALALIVIMTAALLASKAVQADEKDKAPTDKGAEKSGDNGDSDAPVHHRVIFKPPTAGAPAARTGGASRGPRVPRLWVYSPLETGLTVSAKPKLYWYQDHDSDSKLVLTIIGSEDEKPLIQVTLEGSRKQGVYAYDLASQSVELTPGVEYEWSIRMVMDPKAPSNDPFSSGWIKRIKMSEDLKQKLAAGPKENQAETYAAEGLWYDALAAVGAAVDADSTGKTHLLRADLLDQVALSEPAKYERSLAGK